MHIVWKVKEQPEQSEITVAQGWQVDPFRLRKESAALLQTHWLEVSRVKGRAQLMQVLLPVQARQEGMQD